MLEINNPPFYAQLSRELGYEFGPLEELEPPWTYEACAARTDAYLREAEAAKSKPEPKVRPKKK